MSKGCFRVIYDLFSEEVNEEYDSCFVPISQIRKIRRSNKGIFRACGEIHEVLKDEGVLRGCNCQTTKDNFDCVREQRLYQICTFDEEMKNERWFVVHPSEEEHMERYLAGTDDPMYDFVHEMRYNPDSVFGKERQEAEAHFKKQKIDPE